VAELSISRAEGGAINEVPSVERGVSGGGIPFPSRLGGLRERRKLPQRGLGQSRKRIFGTL